MYTDTARAVAKLREYASLEGAYFKEDYDVGPVITVMFKEKEGFDATYIPYLEGIWAAIVYMYHDIDAYKINTFSSRDMYGDVCHGIDIMFGILHK